MVAEGWSLRYEGGRTVTIEDENHKRSGTVAVDESLFQVAPGRHSLAVDAQLVPSDQAKARLELRPRGREEEVG